MDGPKLHMPSLDESEEFKEIVVSMYPNLPDVWFLADGALSHITVIQICIIQARFNNVWTHDHSLFFFAPSGLIIPRTINISGNVHDSQCTEQHGR